MASTATESNTFDMQPQGSDSKEGPEPAELPGLQVAPQTVESGYLLPENAGGDSSSPRRDVSGIGEGSQSEESASTSGQTLETGTLDEEGSGPLPEESKESSEQTLPLPEQASDGRAPDVAVAVIDSGQGETDNTESGAPPQQPDGGALDQAAPQDEKGSSYVEGAPQEEKASDQEPLQPALELADQDGSARTILESGSVDEQPEAPGLALADLDDKASSSQESGSVDEQPEAPGLASAGSDDKGSASLLRQNARAQVYTRRMRQGVAIFCSVLGLMTFLLSTVLTYQIALPGIQHMFFKSLIISNETEGFNSPGSVSYGLYKSWYFWNITNQNMYTTGVEPPLLKQVGPYTMQQVVKIKAVKFPKQGEEVLRSTILYGIYDPEKSCDTCSLGDSLTVVNEVFMATIDSQYHNDPIALLQAYVPGLITDALQHIEAYLMTKKKNLTPAAAQQLARQQFRLCNTLDPKKNISIIKVDATYTLKYAPEYCAWAANNAVKYSPTTMNATELNMLLSMIFSAETNPVAKVVKLINPKIAHFQSLSGLSLELSVGILEYLNYLVKYLAQQYFSQTVVANNGGIIVTRTVGELLYGYYDPWLQSIHGNGSAAAWVTQIHTKEEVEHPSRPFPEAEGYMGINRGTSDISKLYWITQQGTIMQTSPAALNAKKVDWEHGSVTVEAPSGLFFGPLKTLRGQNVTMWLDNWMRHITLRYIGVGHVHGLEIYKYILADSSLDACETIPTSTRKLQTEGPCIYPNRYRGLINMSRFQSAVFQTLPHFYRADPNITSTLGPGADAMHPDAAYDLTMDIEPYFGASVNLSIWFQKVFEVQRLTYLYEKLWIGNNSIEGSLWIPHSYYHIETTANKSVCDALAAATSTLSAVVFFMINVVPFFSAGCLICGLQCLWRRKKLTMCYIVCIEGRPEEAASLELVTAVVMDHKQLQEVLKVESQVEQQQKAELSWRRFNQHLVEHTHRDAELTKQHAEHRRATIAQAEREAAAREQARRDLEGDMDQPHRAADDLQSTSEQERETAQPLDSARSVSLLEVETSFYEVKDSRENEEIQELDNEAKPEWARTMSLVEVEGPIDKTRPSSFAELPKESQAASLRDADGLTNDPTPGEWSRTTSLIESSDPFTNTTIEWSRTASLIEAWGPGPESSRTWSGTLSPTESEGSGSEFSTGWSRSASLIEAEEGRLRWLHPRTARMSHPNISRQGKAVLSSISDDTPIEDQVKYAAKAETETSVQESGRPEDGEETAKRRVTFKDE